MCICNFGNVKHFLNTELTLQTKLLFHNAFKRLLFHNALKRLIHALKRLIHALKRLLIHNIQESLLLWDSFRLESLLFQRCFLNREIIVSRLLLDREFVISRRLLVTSTNYTNSLWWVCHQSFAYLMLLQIAVLRQVPLEIPARSINSVYVEPFCTPSIGKTPS